MLSEWCSENKHPRNSTKFFILSAKQLLIIRLVRMFLFDPQLLRYMQEMVSALPSIQSCHCQLWGQMGPRDQSALKAKDCIVFLVFLNLLKAYMQIMKYINFSVMGALDLAKYDH